VPLGKFGRNSEGIMKMQFVAHANDRTPGQLFGRGPTPEAAMAAAKGQFAGAMQFWPRVKSRMVITEMPDDFRGDYE
jgi:hypothetical protein